MKIKRINTYLIALLLLIVYSFKLDNDKFDVIVFRPMVVNSCLESHDSISSHYLDSIPQLVPFVLSERFTNCSISFRKLNRSGYQVDMNLIPIDCNKAEEVMNIVGLHTRKENRKLNRNNNWNYINTSKMKRLHLVLIIKDGSIISRHRVFMSMDQIRKGIK